jgi:glucose/arabinose dehydrogenase
VSKSRKGGKLTELASSGLIGPVNDLLWHNGKLFISHRTKISVMERSGAIVDVLSGLPSEGDHHNNQLAAGQDGRLYVGQGTFTNSGVVGPDNARMGWLAEHPDLHDVPPVDLALRGRSFESENPLAANSQQVSTSAFSPFGRHTLRTHVVEGQVKSNGTILSFKSDGSDLKVHAWGFRNPYGIIFSGDGRLFATENGFDVRGSRPIANDPEDLYIVKQGAWYGWPDYAAGIPVTDPQSKPKNGPTPEFLMVEHPPVEKPIATFPKHSAVTKLDVAPKGSFGFQDQLFIAFFGHMTPVTGTAPEQHGGHRVIRFDPATGKTEEFFAMKSSHGHGEDSTNEGTKGSQSTKSEEGKGGGRFVDVRFSRDGSKMYVVDFGKMEVTEAGPKPHRRTGVVWEITRKKGRAQTSNQ